MSWLLGGRRQPSSAEKIAMMEMEMEMSISMFDRLIQSCVNKCVPSSYHEAELNKGESVCLDRCVSKFFATAAKIQEKAQGEQAQGSSSGGMFGM